MRCPYCQQAETKPWEGTTKLMGFELPARGEKCVKCEEVTFSRLQAKALEKEAAKKIVARGIRKGAELKFIRKLIGLKAIELAPLLDVQPNTVSRWERDEVAIPRLTAFVIGLLFERPDTREQLEALAEAA